MEIAFGPVPSRRLGQSLGVNNVPAKTCSYSCVYCQLGPTAAPQFARRAFFAPETVVNAVRRRVEALQARGERIDYLTFVPEGEPTLDQNLGREIVLLKELGLPVAVITNASLIDRAEVRAELRLADLVSVKVDAASPAVWRSVNRPHPGVDLAAVRDGLRRFTAEFAGTLLTETMLVAGVNDGASELTAIAGFIAELEPTKAYLGYPTRPPAEPWVRAPDEAALGRAYAIFRSAGLDVELLPTEAKGGFGFTGDAASDLLAATAVHPMRDDEMEAFLAKAGADWSLVTKLLDDGSLHQMTHRGHRFYVRRVAAAH